MNKIVSMLIMVTALSACPVFAQSGSERSLLWEISGNGLKTSSYLFGSVHGFDTAEFQLPDDIFKMIATSSVTACEVDITNPALMRGADFGSVMKGEKENCIATELDKSYREKLEAIFIREPNNMGLVMAKAMIKNINPHYLSVMVAAAGQIGSRKMNYQTEKILLDYARTKGRTIVSLETMQEQLNVLSAPHLSHHEKMDALRKSIDDYMTDSLTASKMFTAYKQQDLEHVLGEVKDPYFSQRNINMVDRLIPHLYQGSVFTIVGAAHLPFQNGMIRLLRDKGFTVKPVQIALVVNP